MTDDAQKGRQAREDPEAQDDRDAREDRDDLQADEKLTSPEEAFFANILPEPVPTDGEAPAP